jgi:hypothetical protein
MGQVLHGSARTTAAVRRTIQHSQESLKTLVIIAVGYIVLSNFINPFIAKDMKEVVRWVFIFGVLAAATWFVCVLFSGAEDLIASVRDGLTGKKQNLTSLSID